jgi:thiamine kinase-like enzyme
MAEYQTSNYRIICAVVNEDSAFVVDIQAGATVDELKKAIKVAKKSEFIWHIRRLQTYAVPRQFHDFETNLRDAVISAVTTLHQGNFVHGDIRDVNLMVRNEWKLDGGAKNIKLIDFDWAGPVGITRYPANVNYEEIKRPEGAWDGQLITKEHDIYGYGWLSVLVD